MVAKAYGLPSCQFIQDVSFWGETWRWHISTKDGQNYFFKEKAYYLTRDAFCLQQQLHAFLYDNGGPVVRLCKTTGGDEYLALDGRLFALQEYHHASHPNPANKADIEMLGKTLSLFHMRAQHFHPDHRIPFRDWSLPHLRGDYFPETWQEIMHYTHHLNRLYRYIGDTDFSALSRLRDWITHHSHTLKMLVVPMTWIHGDANCFNCLGNSQIGMVLVDVDNAHWGYRLSDVALAAASVGMIYQLTETDTPVLYQTLRTEYIDALLKGVREIFPFTEAEQRYWPIFLGLGMIRVLINYTDLYMSNRNLARDLKLFTEQTIAMLAKLL